MFSGFERGGQSSLNGEGCRYCKLFESDNSVGIVVGKLKLRGESSGCTKRILVEGMKLNVHCVMSLHNGIVVPFLKYSYECETLVFLSQVRQKL